MSDKPEKIRWEKDKEGDWKGYLGDIKWCEFIKPYVDAGDQEEGGYVFGIGIDGWMLDAETIEKAKPLAEEWTENWLSRADLAKPSEWISVEQVKLLISLVPEWATIVPQGLDSTFYGTCSYEGDMEIKAKVEEIINLLIEPPPRETP